MMTEGKKKIIENSTCYENDIESLMQIYKARKNILNILGRLDYNVKNYQNFSTMELNQMVLTNQLDMLITKNDDSSKVYINFYDNCQKTKNIQKNNINDMKDDLFEMENLLNTNDCLIIIANCDPNDSCKSHLKHIWEQKEYLISVVNLTRLQYNILDHQFVPEHIILNSEEENKFREKYNIRSNADIPEISRFDPVAQVICMKPGQICKIIRPSKNAVVSNYYRICLNK
jgi:DNA-directed RNA polymerase subunit H (RpoH/RPB5)